MKNSKIALLSFYNATAVLAYVFIVVNIMMNAEKIFGKTDKIIGTMAFLLLFVSSASITGLLVLGRPVYLYINGLKLEGIKMLIFTVGMLFLYFLGATVIAILR